MAMNEKPSISLIIPAYNEAASIGACLEQALRHSRGRFSEIIVSDSGSTDRTGEIALKYPGVKVVTGEKLGPNAARQLGLEHSSGELVAFLDADTHLTEGWVPMVEHMFTKRPDVVSLSGPYRYYDGKPFQRFLLGALWWLTAPLAYRMTGYAVLGGNFVARRSALLAMGGFNKNIRFYGDDTDTARRLHQFGKVIFRMDFFVYSSLRRFSAEGMFKTNIVYALNFISQALFHRTLTKASSDIRQ